MMGRAKEVRRSRPGVRRPRLRSLRTESADAAGRTPGRFGLALAWILASSAMANVHVDFSHSYVGAGSVTQNTGDVDLSFSVNATGGVSLAATCSDPDPAAYVAGFFASGTVSNPALWGGSFSVAVGSIGNLRIDNGGNGLSIQGGNAQKIDWSNEVVVATINVPDGTFRLEAVDYANATTSAGTLLDVNGTSYALSGGAGSTAVSSEGGFSISSASDAQNQGFVLAGFAFDILPGSTHSMALGTLLTNDVVVVMAGSSTNFGFYGSAGDSLAIGSAATIITLPDGGGTSPINLNGAELILEPGSVWILDGSNYSNTFTVGDRFELADYGSFNGYVSGIRFRNFDLPGDRDLQLVNTSTSLYYEVVAQTPATGPNIIVVNLDDVSADNYLGFEGRNSLTPTLDHMAASGIRFTHGYTTATVCAPSRYALLTGRYPTRDTGDAFLAAFPLGTLARFTNLNVDLETDGEHIGNWLRQAGYRTGFTGKCHNISPDIGKTSAWPSYGMVPYGQADDPAADPLVNGAMKHNIRVASQIWRERGFDYVDGFYVGNLKELNNDYLNYHHQEWITKHALEFIDENHAQRFFLYMAPTIDHGPIRNDLSRSLGANPDYCPEGYRPGEDYSFMPSRAAIISEVDAGGYDHESARMTWIDYSLQAVTNKLAEYGLQNDTLIIFTADHGAETVDAVPKLTGKTSLYESGMKVPLVMYWPNGITNPGRTYDELVQHIDFVPTLLELAGATNVPGRAVDGESLVPVLNGSTNAVRDELYCEIGYARGVRSMDWKYIAVRYTPDVYAQIDSGYLWKNYDTGLFTEPRPYYVGNSGLGYYTQRDYPHYYDDDQLYNMNADPTERTNLYGQHPAVAYDLKKRLAGYMGTIPNRPFREFDDASTEFSPAPSTAPSAPGGLQMQFLDVDEVRLDWSDAANSELGYIVEESTNGAPYAIVSELPSGSTSTAVSVSGGVEDVVLRVSAYNALGDAAAASDVDLLAPDHWRYRTFGSTTSSNSQWTADADSDGLKTIWEYAFATDPLDSNSADRIGGELDSDGTNTWLQLVVPRDARRSVDVEGRVSTNLTEWAVGEPAVNAVENSDGLLILRSTTPVGNLPNQFLGAEISIP